MKKNIFTLGLMSILLALVSCQNDFDGLDTPTAQQITQTVSLGELTRTSYKEGEGVTMDGNETMTVYYQATDDDNDLSTYTFAGQTNATNDGENNFTFTHPAIEGAESYDYYFMMPHNSSSKINGDKKASYHRLGPVQRPSTGTFDPTFDYIVGKPQTIAADAGAATVVDYKRMLAALKVQFVDNDDLLAGQKIHSVNLTFSEKGTQDVSLQGLFYVHHSDVFADTDFNSWHAPAVANGLTASYDGGISQEGNWDTWFIVRNTTIPACDLTVTVVADNTTLSRTFAFNQTELALDKINTLKINLSKAKGTTATKSFTVDFSAVTKVPTNLVASDGKVLEFSASGCQIIYKVAEFGNSLQVNTNGSFTLPALPDGLKYKAIYLTENVNNGTKDYTFEVKAGETVVDGTHNFNYYNETLRNNGGVLKVEIPEAYATEAVTFTRNDVLENPDNYCRILRLTVEYESESTEPEPELTDYYEIWKAGKDIVIGTEAGDEITVNKTSYSEAAHIIATTTAKDAFSVLQGGGLIFVDSDVDLYYHSTDESADYAQKHIKLNADKPTIIIGCDPTKQPKIKLEGQIYANGSLDVLKNIELNSLGGGIVSAGDFLGTAICKLYVEDCTYYHAGHAISEKNYNTRCFSHVYVLNSIFHQTGASTNRAIFKVDLKTNAANYDAPKPLLLEAVKLVNSVFYAKSDLQQYLVDAGSSGDYQHNTANFELTIKNCSTYGLWQANILARAYKFKSFYFGYNVGWYDNTANKNTYLTGDYAKVATTKVVENNFLVTRANAGGNGWKDANHSNVSPYTSVNSTIVSKDTEDASFPFDKTKMDVEKGYFPINYVIVPANCGASYTTKLWVK